MAAPSLAGTPQTTDIAEQTSATAFSINLPTTGVVEDDVMVVVLSAGPDSGEAPDDWNTPTNWTRISLTNNANVKGAGGDGPFLAVFWRAVPGGGLGSSQDFTLDGANGNGHSCVAVAFAMNGADTTAHDDTGEDFAAGPSNSYTYPDATASGADSFVVRVVINDDDDNVDGNHVPSDHTDIDFVETSNTAGNGGSLGVSYETVASSGSVGTASPSGNLSASEELSTLTIVWANSGGGGGGPTVVKGSHSLLGVGI